jgi:hypothetical protein
MLCSTVNLFAEESKSDRILRISDQMCRNHISYIDNSLIKIVYIYSTMNVIQDNLPKDKNLNNVRVAITNIIYDIDDVIADLHYQSFSASHACVDIMFGPKQPSLANRVVDEVFEKREIINGLREEMCDIYIDNVDRLVSSLTDMLSNLEVVRTNGNVQVICINEKISLDKIHTNLKNLLTVLQNEYTITENACNVNYHEGSKSEFWKAALPAFQHQMFINPYLVLMYIYD